MLKKQIWHLQNYPEIGNPLGNESCLKLSQHTALALALPQGFELTGSLGVCISIQPKAPRPQGPTAPRPHGPATRGTHQSVGAHGVEHACSVGTLIDVGAHLLWRESVSPQLQTQLLLFWPLPQARLGWESGGLGHSGPRLTLAHVPVKANCK